DRDKSEFEVLQQGVKLNTEKIAALLQLFRPAAVQKIESISINETIGKVLRFFEGQKTAVNFKKIFSDTPLNLACNKTEFSMIIYNLLKNAIQSIRGKGISAGEIVISTKIENKHFVIEIEDNGIGIDKAKTETIFDLGYTTKPDGTGVGLYFVKKTIENHYDGRIRVSSQKGKGAVFIIEIPVAINYVLRADDLWS
ncbi:MAG: HAMP domain-containing histidine kinase, partial [Leptospiraceae bacterium]|nr:HAMP domain-containing histidine kinase [Leptospiraceae bacterium]